MYQLLFGPTGSNTFFLQSKKICKKMLIPVGLVAFLKGQYRF